MSEFELVSEFSPQGDQPQAIEKLSAALAAGRKHNVLLGVTASLFSSLGENKHGAPWDNPLFISHVVLAGVGMFGFLGLLLLLLLPRRPWTERFAARAVWVVFPCWAAGVVLAMANVLLQLY